ncbi:MAG TPA: hypothetical protein ENH55_18250, partial [Aurantimonas coralicida]|nr:hypothetical protein [Aurantimonas coralicida]
MPVAVDVVGRAVEDEVSVADVLAGVDEGRLAAAGPDLMADEDAPRDDGVVLASPDFAFEALVLVVAVPGLVAALGEAAAGLAPPTTGGVPAGVAGADPDAPPATAGLADDDADAPLVAAATAGVLASSFVGGVDAADEAGAGFASPGLEGADAAALDAAGDVAPARSADAELVCCAVVVAGVPVPPPDFAAVCASIFAFLSSSVTVFFSALRSIVCPRVCFGFDRRGRLVIAFAPFLLAPARGIARSAHRTQSRRIGPSFVRAAQASSRPNDQSRLVDAFEKRSKPGIGRNYRIAAKRGRQRPGDSQRQSENGGHRLE